MGQLSTSGSSTITVDESSCPPTPRTEVTDPFRHSTNALDLSDGYLLLWRNNGGIEIWKRANDVVHASASMASPLREPSPLAATATQLKQSPFALDAKARPRDLRGVYLPHGFLPSLTGMPFRLTRFVAPWLVRRGKSGLQNSSQFTPCRDPIFLANTTIAILNTVSQKSYGGVAGLRCYKRRSSARHWTSLLALR